MPKADLCQCQTAAIAAILAEPELHVSVSDLIHTAPPKRSRLAGVMTKGREAKNGKPKIPPKQVKRPAMDPRPPDQADLIARGLKACRKDGLVEQWMFLEDGNTITGGPFVALTPKGAHAVSAAIVEPTDERPRWRQVTRDDVGDPDTGKRREPVRSPHGVHCRRLPFPAEVADTRPGPLEEAMANEEYLMAEKQRADGRPELDPESGKPVREEVRIWGMQVRRPKKKMKGKGAKR